MTSLRRNNNSSQDGNGADVENGRYTTPKMEMSESPQGSRPGEDDGDVQKQQLLESNPPSTGSQRKAHSAIQAIWACSLYLFCSVSMVLVNKSLASRSVFF